MTKKPTLKRADERLDHRVTIRYSAADHFRLLDKATRSGLSVGDFIRSRTLDARSRRPRPSPIAYSPHPAESNLAIQIRKVGVNLNQIAHYLHRHQMPAPPELEPLLREIRALISTTFLSR